MRHGRRLNTLQYGKFIFEVQENNMRYVVDLQQQTCDCGIWPINGLPCAHALICIVKKMLNPINFVHKSMSVKTYKNIYSHYMSLIPNESRWPEVSFAPILPPIIKKKAYRPRTTRKRGPTESGRVLRVVSCRCKH